MTQKKALIDDTGIVQNIIIAGESYNAPADCQLIDLDGDAVKRGDGFDGDEFISKPDENYEWSGTEWVEAED